MICLFHNLSLKNAEAQSQALSLTADGICVFETLSLQNIPVLIFKTITIDSCNPHRLKLFRVPSDF